MKRSKNRKEEIYVASAKLFRKRGYVAATMRDIAENVGIEPSSLYSHIKSKEEILINICSACANEFEEGMLQIIHSDKSNQEKINALIDLHLDIAFNKPSSVTVFNDEWRHLPKKELTNFIAKRSAYEVNFISILEDGMIKGEFKTFSEFTLFQLIINSVKWIHYYTKKLTKEQLEEKRKEIKHFISNGFYNKSN